MNIIISITTIISISITTIIIIISIITEVLELPLKSLSVDCSQAADTEAAQTQRFRYDIIDIT